MTLGKKAETSSFQVLRPSPQKEVPYTGRQPWAPDKEPGRRKTQGEKVTKSFRVRDLQSPRNLGARVFPTRRSLVETPICATLCTAGVSGGRETLRGWRPVAKDRSRRVLPRRGLRPVGPRSIARSAGPSVSVRSDPFGPEVRGAWFRRNPNSAAAGRPRGDSRPGSL